MSMSTELIHKRVQSPADIFPPLLRIHYFIARTHRTSLALASITPASHSWVHGFICYHNKYLVCSVLCSHWVRNNMTVMMEYGSFKWIRGNSLIFLQQQDQLFPFRTHQQLEWRRITLKHKKMTRASGWRPQLSHPACASAFVWKLPLRFDTQGGIQGRMWQRNKRVRGTGRKLPPSTLPKSVHDAKLDTSD